jgi:23S rRNA (uracil1939-C5)-methyltransferase
VSDPVIKLAAKGDGITEFGAFVPGAVPGDIIESDGSITPGPHRQAPPCRHFGKCGGCQLQHVDDEVLAADVHDRVADALAGVGIETVIRATHLSPPGSRRRAALRVQRQGKRVLIGFAESKSHVLVDLAQCPVLRPELFALIAPLRRLLATILPDKRSGEVRLTCVDQGVDVLLKGVKAESLEAVEAINDFAAAHRLARLSLDEGYGPIARWEPEPVTVTFAGLPIPIPEGAFLQATEDGERMLVAAVKEAVGASAATADLFAGIGTFALALSGKVLAVEGARDAILSLKAGANRAQRPVTCDHRDLFRRPLTAKELSVFEAVVLDPPRTGAKEQIPELAQSAVQRIAYVSCNPSTFARDARTLVDGGYVLKWVVPVGQFRWSTHVELAACFERA